MGKPLQSDHLADTTESTVAVGNQLRTGRETHRLSIATVAASLHLPPRVIEALEQEDFKQFEPVYVRGYLRNYARLLELKADPLIEAYNQTLVLEPPPTPLLNQPPAAPPARRNGYLLLAAVGLPMLLWLAGKTYHTVEEWREPAKAPLATVQSTLPLEEGRAKPDLILPGQVVSQAPETPKPNSSEPPLGKSEKTEATPSLAAAAPPEPVSQAPAVPSNPPPEAAPSGNPPPSTPQAVVGHGPDNVAIRLTTSAWVSIRDQGGQRLVYENLSAGTERSVQGQAPFAVVLGNYSPATQISFNGKPFEPPKFKTGTVARFTLGQNP